MTMNADPIVSQARSKAMVGLSGAAGRTALQFSVLNWSAWSTERETRAAWRAWATGGVEVIDEIATPALPMLLRRRLSPMGQRVVGAISACTMGLPPARYILATRHGELSRALATLDGMREDGLPSPTDFSMSIHHALLGVMSIQSGNRLGHTALSAGRDSFMNGLLEAAACIAENPDEPVILIYADQALPDDYQQFRESDDAALPLVVAFALGRAGAAAGPNIAIEYSPMASGSVAEPTASPAEAFLAFVLSGAPEARAIGDRSQWVWRRAS